MKNNFHRAALLKLSQTQIQLFIPFDWMIENWRAVMVILVMYWKRTGGYWGNSLMRHEAADFDRSEENDWEGTLIAEAESGKRGPHLRVEFWPRACPMPLSSPVFHVEKC
jgi:hypothetical protein